MERTPDTRAYFRVDHTPHANPYIGFTTFQHFRNDPLYSDIVVDPANHALETEERECYPVPDTTEQNGYAEGFYPDCTIAYIRILWKEFEPEQGVYRFELVEDILKRARECGQTVMLRVMQHSTRACDDVPDWLKKIIPCPERPAGMRVKDSPADPVYLRYFGRAIQALGERFDADPTLDLMDISLTGAWGEGSGNENYPREALTELNETYIRAFPHTQLIGQGSVPWLIREGSRQVPIGWRGDGTGEPNHMLCRYPRNAEALSECWKTAPVSFESYWWLGEWQRQGWDVDDIIERTLRWHVSHFNPKSMPIPVEWKSKIDAWLSKMGYHFAVRTLNYPSEAAPGDALTVEFGVENAGVAPIYHAIPFIFRLKSAAYTCSFETDADIRIWLPGDIQHTAVLTLPRDIPAGEYELQAGIQGNGVTVRLETDVPKCGGFDVLGRIRVLPASGR